MKKGLEIPRQRFADPKTAEYPSGKGVRSRAFNLHKSSGIQNKSPSVGRGIFSPPPGARLPRTATPIKLIIGGKNRDCTSFRANAKSLASRINDGLLAAAPSSSSSLSPLPPPPPPIIFVRGAKLLVYFLREASSPIPFFAHCRRRPSRKQLEYSHKHT